MPPVGFEPHDLSRRAAADLRLRPRGHWDRQSTDLPVIILAGLLILVSLHHTLAYLVNLLKPTGYVMHQQFNIKQLYALPTLYLCVLYLSENKQRLVPLTP